MAITLGAVPSIRVPSILKERVAKPGFVSAGGGVSDSIWALASSAVSASASGVVLFLHPIVVKISSSTKANLEMVFISYNLLVVSDIPR